MIIEKLNINCEQTFFEEIDFSKTIKDIWSLLEISKDKIYVGYDVQKSLCLAATDIYAVRPLYMYKNVITDNIELLEDLEIDEASFDEFLKYGFMVAPRTQTQ